MPSLAPESARRPLAWASWRTTLVLALAVFAARVVYLVWLCPYQLAGDEAQYWDWSRRLDLSYYSKGPGVAWVIAASTRLLGSVEWAVRLPAAVASCVATLVLARLAARLHGGDERVGFVAAALYQFAPVYYATSQFMTIDAPYFACWVLAAMAGWRLVEGRRRPVDWLWLGVAAGIGLLFKYTILLLVPGVLAYLARREVGLGARQRRIGFLLAGVGLLAAASPVLVWNARHGWPTVAHLIGNVGLPGGDLTPRQQWTWNPLWTLGYVLYPLVVLGPALAALVVMAVRDRAGNPESRPALRYALYTATPVAVFYLMVSFMTDIELNWPVAGYTVLLAPAAGWLVGQAGAGLWKAAGWRWSLAVGVVGAAAVSFGTWPLVRLGAVEIHGRRLDDLSLVERVTGHRAWAARVDEAIREVRRATGAEPFIVGKNHATAALLAFYLPGQPVVRSAGHLFGGRQSAYDYFDDTRLTDPALKGRPAVLVGAQAWNWTEVMVLEHIERVPVEGRVFAAYGYGGPARVPGRSAMGADPGTGREGDRKP